jgi:hypothetical protein
MRFSRSAYIGVVGVAISRFQYTKVCTCSVSVCKSVGGQCSGFIPCLRVLRHSFLSCRKHLSLSYRRLRRRYSTFCSVLSTFFLSRRRQKEKEARIPTYTTQPGFGRCPSHERKLNDTTNKCALSFDAIDVTLTGGVLLGWMPVAGTWLCCLVHVPGSPLLHDHVAALYTTEIAHIPNEVRQPLHYR